MIADGVQSIGQAGDAPMSALGKATGLDEPSIDLMGQAFKLVFEDTSFEASHVFDRFRQTASLQQALNISPDLMEFIYARAHQMFAIGQSTEAENLFRALCYLDGNNYDYWLGLGVSQRSNDAYAKAILSFETAVHVQPLNATPYFHIAEIRLRQGNLNEAKSALLNFSKCANTATPQRMLEEARKFARAIEFRENTKA